MSRVAELLAMKRANQIAEMHGQPAPADEAEIDAAIDAVAPPKKRKTETLRGRLFFTPHAKRRMSQRGMNRPTVYAIWRTGEPTTSGDCIVYRVTDKAMPHATERDREAMRGWRGAAIVVRHDVEPGQSPVLVTVLADGEDTTFHMTGTANGKRRRRRHTTPMGDEL